MWPGLGKRRNGRGEWSLLDSSVEEPSIFVCWYEITCSTDLPRIYLMSKFSHPSYVPMRFGSDVPRQMEGASDATRILLLLLDKFVSTGALLLSA
jgi:hypothetical protein